MRRLLIRPGAIGDCILALPAMERLRAPCLEVWVAPQNVPLIRFADRVRSIAETGLDWLGLPDRDPPPALIERLAGFDSVVSWYGASRPEFRTAVAALGLPFRFLPFLPEGARIHAADFYLQQVEQPSLPAVPRLHCPRWQGGFAIIHPFSGSPKKNWPLENYRALAARLGRRMPVKWCAGPAEPLEDAVRFDNLYELACWLAGARLYIGNDSGITHLAAAAGTPVVAVFVSTDPAVWAPRGQQVRVVTTGKLDDVIAAAERLIGPQRTPLRSE